MSADNNQIWMTTDGLVLYRNSHHASQSYNRRVHITVEAYAKDASLGKDVLRKIIHIDSEDPKKGEMFEPSAMQVAQR